MWRFVHITDPHLASTTDGRWNNEFLCTMMPDVMDCLRGDLARIAPDFLLATGDIMSRQTREAAFEARALMDSLGIPYFPLGGNHDFLSPDSRRWFMEAFGDLLPGGSPFYSFTHKNLHFCMLDAWWKGSNGNLSPTSQSLTDDAGMAETEDAEWAIPPHEAAWLEEQLQARADMPTVIGSHYPLIAIPHRQRRPGMMDAGGLDNGDLLVEALARHPQVKAVFSGHVHLHFIERNTHLTHVSTGALPEYPTEFREVRVYEDRMEVLTHGLSDPSFAERSRIPGREWTRGEEEDRRAVIPL